MIINNIAKLYDIVSVYQIHFWVIPKNEFEYENIKDEDILDDFLPFLYSVKGNSFIESIFLNDLESLKNNELTSMFERLLNCRITTNCLLEFYFGELETPYKEGDYTSLKYLGKVIANSDLQNEVKSKLLSFLFDPEFLIQKLVSNLISIAQQISSLYEKEIKRFEALESNFNQCKLIEIANRYGENSFDFKKPMYYSFGIVNSKKIIVKKQKDFNLIYVGIDYDENQNRKERFKLDVFGNAIAEQNRVTILEYILKKGTATTSDINHILGYSGTTSYYHLALMQKIGMLNVESKGRTLHYSISKEYFKNVISYITNYQ